MTTPQPAPDAASPVASPTPADGGLTPGEQEAVAALTAFLAEAALVGAVTLPPYLYAKLLALGLRRDAVRAAAALANRGPMFRTPLRGPRQGGTAAAVAAGSEPRLRALYILAAAKRITRDLRTVIPPRPGQSPPAAGMRLRDALRRERRFYRQHLDAQRGRRAAAHAVDDATRSSPYWRWTTQNDDRVEPDCARLAGLVFRVDQPPMLRGLPTFPGAAHPRCRCYAAPLSAPARSPFGRYLTVASR